MCCRPRDERSSRYSHRTCYRCGRWPWVFFSYLDWSGPRNRRSSGSHASAIGCYFRDPENNPTEVFWLTGHTSWAQISIPTDIVQPDEAVMADMDRSFEVAQNFKLRKATSPETVEVIREVNTAAVASR